MNTLALLLGAAFTTWWVDPYGDVPYLPDAEPHGGVVTNVLSCAAAKGEIETISFSVQPSRDLKKVDFRPSDLTGPGGAKIPAACADFALVKCWYRAGGRWRTSWCGNHGKPELINDLVLHDNDLIRVVEDEDYAKREEFTLDQLNAAATVLNSAFAMSGTTQRERFESILSMVAAYLAGGQPQAAIDYAEARLQDTKLFGPDKTALYIRKASGYIAMSDWDAAARVYRFAHQEGGRIGREVLKSEGWVAEQREDWKTAQSCYGAESKMYGSEEEDLKAGCVARCARVTKKLREKERDVVLDAEDIINGTIDIELDE